MSERSATHSTFTLERGYSSPPNRVFDAFSDPAKKRRWFAEGAGFHVDSFAMDFRVGGIERACFRFVGGGPVEDGTPCINDTVYLDIVPDRRIVIAYAMTIAGARISASLGTTEFLADGRGTRLVFTEQAAFFEGGDGPESRQRGSRELLQRLAEELGE